MKFSLTELKTKAATLAEKENQNYIVILKSGAVRPERNTDSATPACINNGNEPLLIYPNCKWCKENNLSLTF